MRIFFPADILCHAFFKHAPVWQERIFFLRWIPVKGRSLQADDIDFTGKRTVFWSSAEIIRIKEISLSNFFFTSGMLDYR